ncbi:carbohydrate kinase [Pseudooceanicola sp. CBS1P-1]|uniref:Carbohydrate kinase n=1 Tax=Pseudooceanicola albus TaxID=2692189 RepID=A0A6L7G140_9RHOB|nr:MULTISPECIES: carbohydrate kinase [Pseudooceanicola]MBT9383395.1 carbohydrate kinase [Pseudooceanicola endophyticus]MXN16283.1 carbohydrate kinase [Pseudooceanicola albus]
MIICCGEALIDMIPGTSTEGDIAFRPLVGGAIFNTAIALGRLGADCAMISGLSTDLFGDRLSAALAEAGVSTDLLVRKPLPTTLAFVTLVDGKATYDFYDENSAGRMITAADLPTVPDAAKALYFGGISLAVEPGAEAYAALCRATPEDRVVMVDPNIRPGFIRDEAAFRARLATMLSRADIVKISDEDLDWLEPDPMPLAAKAARIAPQAITVVTRGADGVLALFGGTEIEVPARKAQVVDTVGAGDTFNAGLLFRLEEMSLLTREALRGIRAEDLAEALDFGARVAAVTVSRAGANPPYRHELPA